MQELWHSVPGWELRYEVSNTGKVRSLPFELSNPKGDGKHVRQGRTLKPRLQNTGYLHVILRDKGRNLATSVHLLVAKTFLPACPGPIGRQAGCWQVDHIDENKTNNHVYNLQWLPRDDNNRKSSTGLTPEKVKEIRLKRFNGASLKDLALFYSKAEATISLICNRKTWDWVA